MQSKGRDLDSRIRAAAQLSVDTDPRVVKSEKRLAELHDQQASLAQMLADNQAKLQEAEHAQAAQVLAGNGFKGDQIKEVQGRIDELEVSARIFSEVIQKAAAQNTGTKHTVASEFLMRNASLLSEAAYNLNSALAALGPAMKTASEATALPYLSHGDIAIDRVRLARYLRQLTELIKAMAADGESKRAIVEELANNNPRGGAHGTENQR